MDSQPKDNAKYLEKKRQYDSMITLYGRKPVLEVLRGSNTEIHRLHLATSNKTAPIIDEIKALADTKNIEIKYHDRAALSRISKNAKQDQGVAADIIAPNYRPLSKFSPAPGGVLLLLDRITNPQNLGMIIRSVAASPISGLVLPKSGCARISPLVIKASAGALFKATIYHCEDTISAIQELKNRGMTIYGLDADGDVPLAELNNNQPQALVLGNETDGLAGDVIDACDQLVMIPLANQVESLNVVAAATLVVFRGLV